MMQFKLFNFKGIPVYLKIWFLILFAIMPVTTVIVLFISVLLHELSHSYIANKLGYNVSSVYIDIFNGAALIDTSNMPEIDSIKVVSAGPISNAILCLAFYGLEKLGLKNEFVTDMININAILFAFNIIPIYPLDGGRILKDILFMKMKSRLKARKVAGYTSLFCCFGLLVFSLFYQYYIMAVFSCILGYYALSELGLVKRINI